MLRHENLIKILVWLFIAFNRNQDPIQRKEYVKIHDDVLDAGGDVKIFSSMHVSGERKSASFAFNSQLITNFVLRTSSAHWHRCNPPLSYART